MEWHKCSARFEREAATSNAHAMQINEELIYDGTNCLQKQETTMS
jgi:hypothetical protein